LVRLKNHSASPKNQKSISRVAYELVKAFNADVGNLRISSTAIELDLLIGSPERLRDAVGKLEKHFGMVLTLRKLDTPFAVMPNAEAVKLGVDLFNEERYWESHEALEHAWRNAAGDEKEVLQGIILLAAALVHLQKGEDDVALSILGRAYTKLSGHNGSYLGINIDTATEKVNAMLSSRKPEIVKI
jgi:predicted metal-dependent hydrolase